MIDSVINPSLNLATEFITTAEFAIGMRPELEKLIQLADPLAQSMGLELLKVELASESGRRILRIYLDKAEGNVGIEECGRYSEALSPMLDVEGNLAGSYHLEVSSPGLNRPLVRLPHFFAQVGKIILVQTETDIEGRRHFKGELKEVKDGDHATIKMEIDRKEYVIPFELIQKASLDYFASEEKMLSQQKRHKK